MVKNMFIKKVLLGGFLAGLLIQGTLSAQQDNVPGSMDPPGKLSVKNVPMFVSIGFDDNGFDDGMNWILDYLKEKKNPKGNGNTSNFSGTPCRVTFFCTSDYQTSSWKRAYQEGHEIANHTKTHGDNLQNNNDKNTWLNEMKNATNEISTLVGLNKSEIVGFRTPFLAYSEATFQAMKEIGFLYDCSIEHDNDGGGVWPYTLDKGPHSSAAANMSGKYAGVWEMPVHNFSDGTTGFDWNLWFSKFYNKTEFIDVLKKSFDAKYNGNRSPLFIGAHTDIYAPSNKSDPDLEKAKANTRERQESIEALIDYALTKPETRIVRFIDVIKWMRQPVGLDMTGLADKIKVSPNLSSSISMKGNEIFITIPKNGVYSVSLTSMNGKQVYHSNNALLVAGTHTLRWNLNSSSQVYIVKVVGEGLKFENKVALVHN